MVGIQQIFHLVNHLDLYHYETLIKNITPVFDDPYPTKLVTKQFHLLSDVMKLKYLETLRVDIQYRSSFKPLDLVMDQMLAINKCNFSLNTFSI